MSVRLLVLTLAVLIVIPAILEGVTRFGFSRISALESRVATEHSTALQVRQSSVHPSVLFVGNSLLLDDVDFPELRRLLPRDLQESRFAVEATWLLDWKYGIRRLFADGARPDVLVLVFDPTQLVVTAIRGDYSAYYLFNASDIPSVARELGLTRTAESGLYLARYSLFWAGRSDIRNFVTHKVFADYAELLHNLAVRKPRTVTGAAAVRVGAQRLREVAQTARAYGARIFLVMPPGFDVTGEHDLVQSATEAGITTVIPLHSGALPLTSFTDGYHLNPQGAELFTRQLAEQLAQVLAADARGGQRGEVTGTSTSNAAVH